MKIPRSIMEAIMAQAEEAVPIEACGYLAGNDGEVVRHIPMTNADQSEVHFTFAPEEQFQAIKAARQQGLQLMAVYHSHPATPARPSEEDIRLAYDPDIIYVIISLADEGRELKAFRIKGGRVTPEAVEIL